MESNLGNLIRSARENKKMTRAELAEKVGVTASAISNWENNIRYPRFEELTSLVKTLGIGNMVFEPSAIYETQVSPKEIREMSKKIDYLANKIINLEMRVNGS